MLDGMRRNARSWVIKLIFAVIILVFVFWGVGGLRVNKRSVLAKVNGEPIMTQEFLKAYQSQYERILKQNPNLTSEDLKRFGLKKAVFDQLVNQKLLLQKAKELGIYVSSAQLRDKITSMDVFKDKDKVFDPKRYEMVLASNNLTPSEFESLVENDMRIKALKELITSSVTVTESEIRDLYNFIMREGKIKYLVFDPKDYVDKVSVTNEEIKNYYNEHKNEFKEPEKIQIKYIKITPDSLAPLMNVTDKEIESYYEKNKSKFYEPETRKVAHILIKIDKNDKDGKKAKKKIIKILKRIKKGEDFHKLAKKYSQGPSAKDGGDIGWIKKGDTVKEFEQLAFSLKKGEVGGPVKTMFGYHLILVEDIKAAHYKSLDEVKLDIKDTLAREKAMDKIEEYLDKALDLVFNTNSLDSAANKLDLTVQSTKLLSKKEIKTLFNLKPEDIDQLFLMENNKVYETPIIIKNGYMIVKKVKDVPERIKALKEVKEIILKELKRQKAEKLAREKANKVLNILKKGDVPKNYNELIKESEFFKLSNKYIPNLGFSDALTKDLLLSPKGKWLPGVYKINEKFVLVKLEEVKGADEKNWKEQKVFWEKMVEQRKKELIFRDFLNGIRKNAKIEILNPEFLQS